MFLLKNPQHRRMCSKCLFYYAASGQGIVNSAQTKVWVDVDISMYRGSMFNFLLLKLCRDFTMDNMTLIIDFMIGSQEGDVALTY